MAEAKGVPGKPGTVVVELRFWRDVNAKEGKYLPSGQVWPMGMVQVRAQDHVPGGPAERMVNHPFEWMGAIQAALKDAGITMVPPRAT
jgi:hypothetical protein